jgi:CRISPR-associated endoribonuclease Cas6
MPVRIVVGLVPRQPAAVPPKHTGPAVSAVLLDRVRMVEPGLAEQLHDMRKPKSFTVTPLLTEADAPPSVPGQPARFEIGLLMDSAATTVLAAFDGGDVRVGQTIYRIDSVRQEAASYDELSFRAEPRTQWAFDLITPVSFATNRDQGARRQLPWPDPERVFTNLATRWDTFAPAYLTLPSNVRVAIGEHLECGAFEVRSGHHLVEPTRRDQDDGYRTGAIGWVTYRLVSAKQLPDEAVRALDGLAGFTRFAGMGDRTAVGMGYVRPRPERPPRRSSRRGAAALRGKADSGL